MKTENTNQDNNQNQKEDNKQNDDNKKEIVTIENSDFSKNTRINSPRSLEAMKKLGIEQSELIKLSIEEFKAQNPDVKKLSKDLVKFRYEANEKYRNNTIDLIKEERNNIEKYRKNKKKTKTRSSKYNRNSNTKRNRCTNSSR